MSNKSNRFNKDDTANKKYTWDWSSWLAVGETIVSSSATVPAGLSEGDFSFDDTTASQWLSGGVPTEVYIVAVEITTSDGRTDERSIIITVIKEV